MNETCVGAVTGDLKFQIEINDAWPHSFRVLTFMFIFFVT